jgi:hypothetical protein
MNGKGKMTRPDGTSFEGYWENNKEKKKIEGADNNTRLKNCNKVPSPSQLAR